ncbi:MAG: hypothetical protein HZB51_30180 [Chloroflexi bacterium]|nr:hypothetical protein [Chloroflexota bacterium]
MLNQPPIRKTEARVAERRRARTGEQRPSAMKKFIPLVVVFVVAVFVIFVGIATLQEASNPDVQGATGPRLQVDREKIDLGKQIFDKTVRAAFTVKNIGDSTLKLEAPRVAALLEGC